MKWLALDAYAEDRLRAFEAAFCKLNRYHNLVARGDAVHFWERHIMHCLALTRRRFAAGAHIVDWGTGGGLPAVPLAIVLPENTLTAVDSVQRKIWAVHRIRRELSLTNLHTWCGRAEAWTGEAAYSISRAVAPLETLWRWHARVAIMARSSRANVSTRVDKAQSTSLRPAASQSVNRADTWEPGLICLKGGDLSSEIAALRRADAALIIEVLALDDLGPWFSRKAIVHVASPRAFS